jgi:hypothetical protein
VSGRTRVGPDTRSRNHPAERAFIEAEWDAGQALISTAPTTIAGASAFAGYIVEYRRADEIHGHDSLVDEYRVFDALEAFAANLQKLAA